MFNIELFTMSPVKRSGEQTQCTERTSTNYRRLQIVERLDSTILPTARALKDKIVSDATDTH